MGPQGSEGNEHHDSASSASASSDLEDFNVYRTPMRRMRFKKYVTVNRVPPSFVVLVVGFDVYVGVGGS